MIEKKKKTNYQKFNNFFDDIKKEINNKSIELENYMNANKVDINDKLCNNKIEEIKNIKNELNNAKNYIYCPLQSGLENDIDFTELKKYGFNIKWYTEPIRLISITKYLVKNEYAKSFDDAYEKN